jgi:hypothetical protein
MNVKARKKLPVLFVKENWNVWLVMGRADILAGIVTGTGNVLIVITDG